MLTIACLLKNGPGFNHKAVKRLMQQCEIIPHTRFVCLSDSKVPCERIELQHNWPRWWGQLELFRPGLFDGPVLYMDLDTTIIRDPKLKIGRGEFWSLKCPKMGKPTSGIMAWDGDFSHIYKSAHLHRKSEDDWVNDGIFPHVQPKIIQDHYPGFYSYKVHVRDKKLPRDADVVYFHGHPRPWQLTESEPYKALLQ